jgi:prolipoprotein diacylglyceryltransferase
LLLFCIKHKKKFLELADVLAIAGAYIMGVGRIGNFIDGHIDRWISSRFHLPWHWALPAGQGVHSGSGGQFSSCCW